MDSSELHFSKQRCHPADGNKALLTDGIGTVYESLARAHERESLEKTSGLEWKAGHPESSPFLYYLIFLFWEVGISAQWIKQHQLGDSQACVECLNPTPDTGIVALVEILLNYLLGIDNDSLSSSPTN